MQNISFSFSEDYDLFLKVAESFNMRSGDNKRLGSDRRILFLLGKKGEETVSLASGIYFTNENSFQIFDVRARGIENLMELAKKSVVMHLNEVRKRFRPRFYEWIYDLPIGMKDEYEIFLKELSLPWLNQISKEVIGKRIYFRTSVLKNPKKLHNTYYFSLENFQKMGFDRIWLKEIDRDLENKIIGVLDDPNEDTEGLSPLDVANYDENTSFAVTEKATGDVVGWILCSRHDNVTEFRRWYIVKRFRLQNLGIKIIALLFHVVQETSEYLGVFMLNGSQSISSLSRLYKSYFKGSIASEMEHIRLTLADKAFII